MSPFRITLSHLVHIMKSAQITPLLILVSILGRYITTNTDIEESKFDRLYLGIDNFDVINEARCEGLVVERPPVTGGPRRGVAVEAVEGAGGEGLIAGCWLL